MIKIALGLGHRVLGPEWTFGPGGMMLRSHLFPGRKNINFGALLGTIDADLHPVLQEIFGITDNRHIMAVFPAKALDYVFSIPLDVKGARPLETRSIHQIANLAAMNGLLPNSRAAATALLR